jgi:hypothetical protein
MLCAPFGVAATNSVPTNFISIHLVAKPGSTNTFLFSGEKFDAKPILADADFVEFDADRQTFTVKGPAALRLSNAIHSFVDSPPTILNGGVQELIAFPTVFVLEAEGKPIYRGRFHTLTSSHTYRGPLFVADHYVVSPNQADNVTFERHDWDGGNEGRGKANTPGDPRIAKAAAKLIKARGM